MTRIAALLALTFLGQHCSQNPASAPHVDSRALDSLFAAADRLSPEELYIRTSSLPGTLADTFYQGRLDELHNRQDAVGMGELLAQYERLRPKDAGVEATGDYYRGVLCQFEGKYDSAEIWYAKSSDWFEKAKDYDRLTAVLGSRSGCYNVRGKMDESIAMKYKILEIQKAGNDERGSFETEATIANAFNLKGDYDKALEIILPVRAYFEKVKDTMYYSYATGIQGNAMLGKKNYSEALALHKIVLGLRKQLGVRPLIQESYYNVGRSIGLGGDWANALDTLRIAEEMAKSSPNKQGLVFIQSVVGEALFNTGRLGEAEHYLQNSLLLSLERKHWNAAAIAAAMLYKSRKQTGNTTEALQYLEQQKSLADSSYNKEKEKIVREAAAKYETEKKDKEIALRRAEVAELQRRNTIAYGFGLGTFLLLGGLWWSFRNRRKRLEAERRAELAEKEQLAAELESRNRELTTFTLQLAKRNELLQTLQTEISGIGDKARSLGSMIRQNLNDEQDWEQFRQHFEKVHPEFWKTMQERFPSLTVNDLRMLCLIRLNLSNKEIAAILHFEPASIISARYRIKKKMGLSEEEDFNKIVRLSTPEELV